MATVPRALIDAFTAELDGISDAAKKAIRARLDACDPSNIKELYGTIVELMEAYCGASADMAAAATADFYDAAREVGYGERLGAAADPLRSVEATEEAARSIVARYEKGKYSWPQMVSQLLDRADYEIKTAANRCAMSNAERDPAKPRWARVPSGAETCGFCIMLASRGYDYLREESASHAHANCDCRVVPQFGKGAIEGYDPEYYEELYERCKVTDDAGTVDVGATAYAIEKEVGIRNWRASEIGIADEYSRRIASARKAFAVDKSGENYNRTIGKTIIEIGKENGVDIAGEFLGGKGRAAACPDGDEIWAIVTARRQVGSGTFVGVDKSYDGHPDFFCGGRYIDIKTPRDIGKVGKRLNHAAEQCHARGQEDGYAVLSSLRYEGRDFADAVSIAEEFVASGTLRTVWAIMPNGKIRTIN